MGFKLRNRKAVSQHFVKMAIRIEKALIFQLEFLVAELQNHAKASAEYQDRTSNAKASIGGAVIKDGKAVTYRGFEGSAEGSAEGLEFINSLIAARGTGYGVIIVAGMEYTRYLEDVHNLNVLKKTELKMREEIPSLIKRLKLKIK